MEKRPARLLGAHMSIAGGVAHSIDRGVSIGCTAVQIFTGFNNRWASKEIRHEDIEEFHKKRPLVKVIFAHNNYLINLASPDLVTSKNSFSSMLAEIERAELLKLPFIVIHPGSHMGKGEENGLKVIAERLNAIFEKTRECQVKILLETTAGQGTNLGWRFEHLAQISSLVNSQERIGICFDTCHSFAAGYDLRTEDAYKKTFDEFDRIIGISRILAFHINDSKNDLGSKRDRHEHIGQGHLGLEAFRLLLNDERFIHIPMILETPKREDLDEDKKNLAVLWSLIER